MILEEIRQRSNFLGTQVAVRNSGKKLGVVSQLWADFERKAIVGFSIRPGLLYGSSQFIFWSSIRDFDDVIWVNDEDAIGAIEVAAYTNLINCEVVTETGVLLGSVRDFVFNLDSGNVTSLILAAIGLPFLSDLVLSTYELSTDGVLSSGSHRLIVCEGSEERLLQRSVGVLERLGIGSPPWERDEDDTWIPSSQGKLGDWDDPAGGAAPSPRPRYPAPTPITDDAAATPD
ncbi:MAG: PRC-barrel domain-containing protein [Stenomitos rutilans HA7619-LM2]|nr:PRC-barrel domain-containing protein [Stenomitos rutilans HA7619-LM2]